MVQIFSHEFSSKKENVYLIQYSWNTMYFPKITGFTAPFGGLSIFRS